MTLPLANEPIAEANGHGRAALDEDYDALNRKLSRTGIDIAAIKHRVAQFSVAVPSLPHRCRRAIAVLAAYRASRWREHEAQERKPVGLGAGIV